MLFESSLKIKKKAKFVPFFNSGSWSRNGDSSKNGRLRNKLNLLIFSNNEDQNFKI